MAAYVIAEVSVTDPEVYEEYKPLAGASVVANGGSYEVRGGAVESLEGEPVTGRIVVLRFDSMEAARDWYNCDGYQAALPLRQAACAEPGVHRRGRRVAAAAGSRPSTRQARRRPSQTTPGAASRSTNPTLR